MTVAEPVHPLFRWFVYVQLDSNLVARMDSLRVSGIHVRWCAWREEKEKEKSRQ